MHCAQEPRTFPCVVCVFHATQTGSAEGHHERHHSGTRVDFLQHDSIECVGMHKSAHDTYQLIQDPFSGQARTAPFPLKRHALSMLLSKFCQRTPAAFRSHCPARCPQITALLSCLLRRPISRSAMPTHVAKDKCKEFDTTVVRTFKP